MENNKSTFPLPREQQTEQANTQTLQAMQEAKDILAGKTPAKRFQSTKELFAELDRLCESERS